MNIVEFLNARLDEDERVAREAEAEEPAPWRVIGIGFGVGSARPNSHVAQAGVDGECMSDEIAEHLARWDPLRILAECEAKRQIIDWCVEVIGDFDLTRYGEFGCLRDDPNALAVTLAVETLKHLATIHADDPDYDESWKP